MFSEGFEVGKSVRKGGLGREVQCCTEFLLLLCDSAAVGLAFLLALFEGYADLMKANGDPGAVVC